MLSGNWYHCQRTALFCQYGKESYMRFGEKRFYTEETAVAGKWWEKQPAVRNFRISKKEELRACSESWYGSLWAILGNGHFKVTYRENKVAKSVRFVDAALQFLLTFEKDCDKMAKRIRFCLQKRKYAREWRKKNILFMT